MKLLIEQQYKPQMTNKQVHLQNCNEIGKTKRPLYEQFKEKPNSILYKDDIEKTYPISVLEKKTEYIRKIHNDRFNNETNNGNMTDNFQNNRYQNNYVPENIDYSFPQKNKFQTTRNVNPLEPIYRLQSFSKSVEPSRNFIRDNIDVSDIDGAKFYQKQLNINRVTNSIDFQQKQKKMVIQDHNQMNTQDINNDNIYSFNSNRVTDPLQPRYKIYQQDVIIDNQKSNLKIKNPIERNTDQFDVKDIVGQNLLQKKNSISTKHNFTNQDIQGSQVGSRPIKINTIRNVNPLQPVYKYLDGTKNDI